MRTILLILALMITGATHAMSPSCSALFEARERTRLARIALDNVPPGNSGHVGAWGVWMDARNEEKALLEQIHSTVTDPPTRKLLDGLRDEHRFHQGLGKPLVAWKSQAGMTQAREHVYDTILDIALRQYEAWVAIAVIACIHPPERS